MTEQHIMTS